MRLALLLLALIFATGARASALHTVEPRTPTAEWNAVLDALRTNDARALEAALVPAEERARERRNWRARRDDPTGLEVMQPQVPELAETLWRQLRTPGGVALIVTAWRPAFAAFADVQVQRLDAHLPHAVAQLAERDELTTEEFIQRRTLLLAFEQWAHATDFGDAHRFERALEALASFAQSSGIATLDEAQGLSPDELVAHGGAALRAAKAVLAAYDLDVDTALRSARITERRDGLDVAIRIDATLLGVPVSLTQRLTYWHGRWEDADYVVQLEKFYREDAAPGGAPTMDYSPILPE